MIARLVTWLRARRAAERRKRTAHVEAAARRLLCQRARAVGRLTRDLRAVPGFERDDDTSRRYAAARLLALREAVRFGALDAERGSE